MIQLLTTNHYESILDAFDSVREEMKLISPFLTLSMAEKLCRIKQDKRAACTFITRFYLEDMIQKSNSLDALELLLQNNIKVYALKRLHTKLYLFDKTNAILGSANFTNGGFQSNIELSLLLSEEKPLLEELHLYFDSMAVQLKTMPEAIVTKEMIQEAKNLYAHLFASKKGTALVWSEKTYGAALDNKDAFKATSSVRDELEAHAREIDIVHSMFQEQEKAEQIKFPFNIWLKFSGEGNDRLAADKPFSMPFLPSAKGNIYVANYPFMVKSVHENDAIYFAGLTTDKRGKNQPVIIGRGILAAFENRNKAPDTIRKTYSWMERYPWYTIIKEAEILDTFLVNGIPMDIVWDALGSDTYQASFGHNETIAAVARKHYQKAHIRLSGNAKQFIDKVFDKLKAQYGTVHYKSAL